VGIIFLLEFLRGKEIWEIFLMAVSLAVAAIPEGLPAVVTIALALGVSRMSARHVLIRKLPSVETLGSTTVICSDKTGTLTKNEMTVQAIFTDDLLFKVSGVGYEPKGEFILNDKSVPPQDYPRLKESLLAGALCNGAQLLKEGELYSIVGDPTEGAILTCAAKAGCWKDDLEKQFPFVEEIPFDAVRKKMTVVRRSGDGYLVYCKGAPEVLLNACNLDERAREKILAVNADLSSQALRVLALAYRTLDKLPEAMEAESVEKELTFLGLLAMIDPPREEARLAIAKCKTAGIKVVMITGDHQNTANAIGRKLGIDKVYARVSPEDKLKIIRALHQEGEVVAMTGDGVNDAPALKESDIGVAMGITGTDVTKEVSDMVVTDDNFASIVVAVEEGRGIYDNIKKFIHYLLSCNLAEIIIMFVSSLAGLPMPLLPVQILWINLMTDGIPALALGVDPVDPAIMERPPRPPDEKIITGKQANLMLTQGFFIAFCSLLAFIFVLFIEKGDLLRARTVVFAVLSVSQLFHAFNCRSHSQSIFKLGIFSNRSLVIAVLLALFMQMAVVSLPVLQKVFKTEFLSLFDWFLVILFSSLPLWAMELLKIVNARRQNLE
jgi:Ca2+-transporting ATPase